MEKARGKGTVSAKVLGVLEAFQEHRCEWNTAGWRRSDRWRLEEQPGTRLCEVLGRFYIQV